MPDRRVRTVLPGESIDDALATGDVVHLAAGTHWLDENHRTVVMLPFDRKQAERILANAIYEWFWEMHEDEGDQARLARHLLAALMGAE